MDFTKTNIGKELKDKTSDVIEYEKYTHVHRKRPHCQMTDNFNSEECLESTKKSKNFYIVSKDTVEKQRVAKKMLNFKIRIKKIQMAIAERSVRERDIAIKKLKDQLKAKNKDR